MLVRHSSQTRGMQSLQRRLAFAGRTVRDIRHPHGMRAIRSKRLIQHVLVHRQCVPRIRGRWIFPRHAGSQPMVMHQSRHRFLADAFPLPP